MLDAYYLIIIYITMINGMIFQEINSQKLDYLFRKLLSYQPHNIITFDLRIKKLPTIKPISEDFSSQWNSVLYNTEKRLVQLLLAETHKVIEKTQTKPQYRIT